MAVSPLECASEMAHAEECGHRQLLPRVRRAVVPGPRAMVVAFGVQPALWEQNALVPAQKSRRTLLETNPINDLLFSYTSFLAPMQITTFCKQFSGQAGINLRARWEDRRKKESLRTKPGNRGESVTSRQRPPPSCSAGTTLLSDGNALPHAAGVLRHHGLSCLADECFLKFRHVPHHAVDPVSAG